MFSNIWQHPKTSVAGILIAIVTVAGVLSQQGITLGNVGTGTWVTLAAALATAFLGLLARDPAAPSGTLAKLPLIAFIAAHVALFRVVFLVCLSMTVALMLSGCAGGSFLTDLESIISTALTGVSGLLTLVGTFSGNPELAAAGALLAPIAQKVQSDMEEIKTLQEQYKANADESILTNIQGLVTTVRGNLASLLQVNGVPAAQAGQISTFVSEVDTELNALLTSLPLFQSSTAGQTVTVQKPRPAAAFKAAVQTALAPATDAQEA